MTANENLVLAFDIGTTRIKAAIINLQDFSIIEKTSKLSKILFPREGWAEINPDDLWKDVIELTRQLLEDKNNIINNIKGIIFAPHMAGVAPVDKNGNPLRNIMIWLDERAAGYPKSLWRGILKVEGYNLFKLIRFLRITGGAPSKTGKDPISKILWIKDNEPDIFNKTHKFLDVKGYLISKMTGKFITSHDEANLTWLVDTRNGLARWHKGLLKEYGIEETLLPEIKDSIEIAGHLNEEVARDLNLQPNIPVLVGAGDLTTAAIGSGAVKENEIHIYIGTSDWIGAHISKRRVDVSHYIGSILSAIPRKYLLVAEQEIASGALDWIMKITDISDYNLIDTEIEKLLEHENHTIIFLPWMYGERCPIDDPYVRGGFLNLHIKTEKIELVKSVMEGVTLNIKWAYGFFEKIIGKKEEVNVVGGGCRLNSWCQMLADATNRVIKRIQEPENAGLKGAAIIAAVGLKIHKSFEDAAKLIKIDSTFKPKKDRVERYNRILKEFEKIYKNLKKTYRNLNRA